MSTQRRKRSTLFPTNVVKRGERTICTCGCPGEYHLADCVLNPYGPRDLDGAPAMVGMTATDYLDLEERKQARDPEYDPQDPHYGMFADDH